MASSLPAFATRLAVQVPETVTHHQMTVRGTCSPGYLICIAWDGPSILQPNLQVCLLNMFAMFKSKLCMNLQLLAARLMHMRLVVAQLPCASFEMISHY